MYKYRAVFASVLVLMLSMAAVTANAGGGGLSGGATEVTQMMNNSELVVAVQKATEQIRNQITQITHQITQITNQLTMIKDMVLNTLSLPGQIYGEVMGLVNNIKTVLDNTKGVMHSLGNVDQIFKERFMSRKDILTELEETREFEKEHEKIVTTRQETVISTMKAIGIMYDQYTKDADLLTQLQQKAETAEGRNQILQAGNQLSAFAAQELMKLRELSMMQANMFATVTESERAKEAVEEAKSSEARRMDTVDRYGYYTF